MLLQVLNRIAAGRHKEETLNTKVTYLYRDADNYKVWNQHVVRGTLTDAQIAEILETRSDREYFKPNDVGLPEKRFDDYDPDVDHPWFELFDNSFESTEWPATLEITADEFYKRFMQIKENGGHWSNDYSM